MTLLKHDSRYLKINAIKKTRKQTTTRPSALKQWTFAQALFYLYIVRSSMTPSGHDADDGTRADSQKNLRPRFISQRCQSINSFMEKPRAGRSV
jgi:hypothetical protein